MQHRNYTQEELGELIKLVSSKHSIKIKELQKFCDKHNRSIFGVRKKVCSLRKQLNISVKYTDKDLRIIQKCVKEYPYNLSLAFADAAVILNRSVDAIRNIYYFKIKHQNNVLFAIFGLKHFTTNCKNISRNLDTNKVKLSKPNAVMSILKKLKIF